MGSVNDFYEIRQEFSHGGGQNAILTMHYRCTIQGSSAPNSIQLGIEWGDNIRVLITPLIADNWTATNINIVNLNEATDFWDAAVADQGELSAACLPPVLAVGIRSSRNDIGVNRSHHQLPMGDVSWVAPDGSMTEAARDSIYFLQQAMGMEITAPNGTEYTPVIIRKIYTNHVLTDIELRSNVLGQWQINRWFGTQKSRQDYAWEVADEPE